MGLFVFSQTATAATAVALKTTVPFKFNSVIVQPKAANAGALTIGAGAATLHSTNVGLRLAAHAANAQPASIVFSSTRDGSNEVDLSKIFLDVATTGEGVVMFCSEA